jgi:hypothetical protein
MDKVAIRDDQVLSMDAIAEGGAWSAAHVCERIWCGAAGWELDSGGCGYSLLRGDHPALGAAGASADCPAKGAE